MASLDAAHAHLRAGRMAEAEGASRDLLASGAESAEVWNLLAIALHEQGRAPEAEEAFRRALALAPRWTDAMSNLAVLLREGGRLEEAAQLLRESLALRPDFAEGHLNLGHVLRMQGMLEEAGESARRAVSLRPDFAEAHAALALVQEALRRPAEAEQSLRRALALRPSLDAMVRLGGVLWSLGRLPEAEECFRLALEAPAATAPAHNSLGIALASLGRLEEAEAAYRRALGVDAGFADAHGNLGNALRDLGRQAEAGACYARALELAPGSANAHLNLAIHHLLLGDYAAGWREYEWRWRERAVAPDARAFGMPRWTGAEPLAGRTLLLHAEQGLGDTIQMCRYLPALAAAGARVLLEVPPALVAPLSRLAGVERVFAAGGDLPAADFHCPLMSLPFACGTNDPSAVPAPGGYLTVDPDAAARWRAQLAPLSERLVGLCWRGNPRNRIDRERSVRLADVLPLLAVPGLRFVSLQEDLTAEEQALVAGRRNFVHETLPFAEKAALVGALDLVISVDTVWAHWAGAIGKPLWVALSYVPAWCWMLERTDSPWYAGARLYRQPRRGDWAGVAARLRGDLAVL